MKMQIMIMASDACNVIKAIMSNFAEAVTLHNIFVMHYFHLGDFVE